MEPTMADGFFWRVRTFVYAYTAVHGTPPTIAQTSAGLGVTAGDAQAAYTWLHDHHALYLADDGRTIRMAHPFSGIPTDFRVFANGRAYWANCAWDMLGIPAALHSDAHIEARYADGGELAVIAVKSSVVRGHGEVVRFSVPFSRWYDDLVHT